MDVLDAGAEPSPRRARATALVIGLVVGLGVGGMVGRAWAQRDEDAAAASAVRLAAVLVFARVQVNPAQAGEDVKLFGELVNTGPATVGLEPGGTPRDLQLGADQLAAGATTTFVAQEALVCRGATVGAAPLLRVRATSPDGGVHDVVLPLEGEAWSELRLQCLPRA